MSLYYFKVEYENKDRNLCYFSANKQELEVTRRDKEREALHQRDTEVKTVYPIKETAGNWEVFTSDDPIKHSDTRERKDGQRLYFYRTYDVDGTYTANISTNEDDIKALHHDDNIPASALEEEKEVTEVRKTGTEIVLESTSIIE